MFVSAGDLGPLAATLGVVPGPTVREVPSAQIRVEIAADETALGIVRAEDVTPDVHALAVDGIALFGNERAARLLVAVAGRRAPRLRALHLRPRVVVDAGCRR